MSPTKTVESCKVEPGGPGGDEFHVGELAIFAGRNYILSVRNLAQKGNHLQRLNQTADSIRETAATAISVNLSMVTLQENETMKRLAAYAALLAAPTMIAGIYGMNFEHMPELKWRYGYALSLFVMGWFDIYLYFRLKLAHWL